ncbi:hypothetical protein E0Z10_g9302 [Xylaria hypoxylon]|uniref:Myb-like DNA-binding domain-containing protein n=1 Tax=Xylaria hypoxylon TaxID=37992 RepID=A0A4Z0YJD4_9PEZI|nr:hypothetical protein E0Z10_g9302 [Xylaria hypoxylon]
MPTGTAADTEAQFRFLISCIRHSTSGKVDFEEVRKECEIISKGAAAKRYERLMKAHNITAGTINGIKNETKSADETKKAKSRATKKRKLEEVNEDEGDIEEPIKMEPRIKGEVKNEDAIVKPECSNDDTLGAAPLHYLSSQSEPASSSTNTQTDDDDDVLFVSATEKRNVSNTPDYFNDHHHSQAHSPVPAITGIQPVNYAANTSFPQQLAAPHMPPPTAAMATMSASNSFSYDFTPTTWVFPHDSHGYL